MKPSHEIEPRIRDFVVKQFPLAKKNALRADDNWLEKGLLDSLGVLDLVQFLEDEFSVKITDDELQPDNFQSLAAVTAFVAQKQSRR